MSNSVTFTAWNIDPAFSAGPFPPEVMNWGFEDGQDSTTMIAGPGQEVTLDSYLVTVTIIDSDNDGFVRPNPQDRIIINGVESGINAVYNGDAMTVNGVNFMVVTFYTDNWDAISIPIDPDTGQVISAFPGKLSQTTYIYESNEFAMPFSELEDISDLCLMAGTAVLTGAGEITVEHLHPGDMVQTLHNGLQPLRWIIADPPGQAPVRIARGALGPDLPKRALDVSFQHRVLVGQSGREIGLLPAKALVLRKGIRLAKGVLNASRPRLSYHLLFDRHEIIFAEGLAVESLLLAKGSIAHLARKDRAEALRALLPHRARWPATQRITPMQPCAPILRPGQIAHKDVFSFHGFGVNLATRKPYQTASEHKISARQAH